MWLGPCHTSRNRLHLTFGFDELPFSTTIWYDDVDFDLLRQAYGTELVEKLGFHIAAFEAIKLVSLCPGTFDPGPFARFVTADFAHLWRVIAYRVWADWRYRHNRPRQLPPSVQVVAPRSVAGPVQTTRGQIDALVFCGGGKDSLVMLRLLEAAGMEYASLAYSHSIYGKAESQHRLTAGLLDETNPRRRHRQWVVEDFLDSPILEVRDDFDVRHIQAAETPASLFAALPLALMHGYQYLLVGHERSADLGNLIWDETGEEVNHQWGKSLEAERMLQRYVQIHLVENVTYASVLKPVNDTVIFNSLSADDPAVSRTHSCNEHKPWCERCAKCAYVWLGYNAYLPREAFASMFGTNLFDTETNQLWFRQLLGLEDHTPFECVGGLAEARLMFEMCVRKGLRGRAIDAYRDACLPLPDGPMIDDLTSVREDNHAMPPELTRRVAPSLREAGRRARAAIFQVLQGDRRVAWHGPPATNH